ncbi:MAG: MATE family efflux transporter [Gemmatimonadaceae bacterium]|nr:MATE family efflux transporter [Gemmatimonadaceae bacterium]
MTGRRAWNTDLLDMARLAAPIVLINVGLQAMGVGDAMMVGRLGGAAIAAVALGNFYVFNVSVFGIGLLFALDPVVSQAIGAGAHDDAARGIQRGFLMALLISAIVTLALMPGEAVLRALGQPEDVVQQTGIYVRHRALGVLPFFLFNAARQALQALNTTRPVVVSVLLANVVNAFANWILITGHWGAPALGVGGSGFATAIATGAMAMLLWAFSRSTLEPYVRPWRAEAGAWKPLQRTLRIGVPIGVQFFFESFAFGLTALFMGWMSTASLAGHEIALNMAAMTFMVPLGISGAAAAVVGRAIGRGDIVAARRDAVAAIACGVGFMCLTAVVFLVAPEWLATRYTLDRPTVAVAAALIPLAGMFQVFDGLQAVTSGVLRGTGDTRIPAMLHMVAFWAVGVPLGAYLGFRTPLRERGLWIGLVAGLAAAAILQSWRVAVRLRGNIARVSVERDAR